MMQRKIVTSPKYKRARLVVSAILWALLIGAVLTA